MLACIPDSVAMHLKQPVLFLRVEIPRYGTDTQVHLELIPMGLNPQVFGYREADRGTGAYAIAMVGYLAQHLEDPNTLTYGRSGEIAQIGTHDQGIISKIIGTDDGRLHSTGELRTALLGTYQRYELWNSLSTATFTLAWNAEKGHFYIRERGTKPVAMTFLEFLKQVVFYSPMC